METNFQKALVKAASFLDANDNFLIIAHDRPDGDTLASSLALHLFLKKIGKKSLVVCKSPVPEVFQFLPGSGSIKTDFLSGDYDSLVLVDNGDLKRTGFDDRIREYRKLKKPIINIDHHQVNDIWKMASINLVNDSLSSTAEIIFELIKQISQDAIDSDISTSILCGLYTDTGGFQHPTTTPEVLALAAELLHRGAKLKKISNNISNQKSIPMLKIWGKILSSLQINKKYSLIYGVISNNDIEEAGASEVDLAGAVNMINSSREASVAMLIYETKEGKIKGSLRTDKDDIDVSKLAALLGGGGHKKASGFSLDGKLKINGRSVEII